MSLLRFLEDLINAADRAAVGQTNFERIEKRLFQLRPTEVSGEPTDIIGPPVDGTYEVYDLWVDAKLAQWRCTEEGTPGNWIQITAAIVEASFDGAPDKYLITVPSENWQQAYYDQGTDTWKPVNLAPE